VPLNKTNTRNAHRNNFCGLTEYVTLIRRNSDGTITANSVRETWVGMTMFDVNEQTVQTDNAGITKTFTKLKLFLRPGDGNRQPPKIGDRIRFKNGDVWEVLGEPGVNEELFGNNVMSFDGVLSVPPAGG